MMCFAHRDQAAIGICTQCGKGVCATCCPGSESELACSEPHGRTIKLKSALTTVAANALLTAWQVRPDKRSHPPRLQAPSEQAARWISRGFSGEPRCQPVGTTRRLFGRPGDHEAMVLEDSRDLFHPPLFDEVELTP